MRSCTIGGSIGSAKETTSTWGPGSAMANLLPSGEKAATPSPPTATTVPLPGRPQISLRAEPTAASSSPLSLQAKALMPEFWPFGNSALTGCKILSTFAPRELCTDTVPLLSTTATRLPWRLRAMGLNELGLIVLQTSTDEPRRCHGQAMTCTSSDGKRETRARTSLPSGLNWALSRKLCGMVSTKCDGVPRGTRAPGKAATFMMATPLNPAYVDTAHCPSGATAHWLSTTTSAAPGSGSVPARADWLTAARTAASASSVGS